MPVWTTGQYKCFILPYYFMLCTARLPEDTHPTAGEVTAGLLESNSCLVMSIASEALIIMVSISSQSLNYESKVFAHSLPDIMFMLAKEILSPRMLDRYHLIRSLLTMGTCKLCCPISSRCVDIRHRCVYVCFQVSVNPVVG